MLCEQYGGCKKGMILRPRRKASLQIGSGLRRGAGASIFVYIRIFSYTVEIICRATSRKVKSGCRVNMSLVHLVLLRVDKVV